MRLKYLRSCDIWQRKLKFGLDCYCHFLTERFQPLWSYHLVYVFKFWRVLYFARAIMSLSWLHKTIWAEICMLYYVYFVKIEYFLLFFGKYQIVAQSLNSPKFENMLPANHFCRKFYGGAACGNQTVIVTIGYVIMSIITKLFGCKLDKQYNAEHLIRRVLPNCIKHSMQVHRGLV